MHWSFISQSYTSNQVHNSNNKNYNSNINYDDSAHSYLPQAHYDAYEEVPEYHDPWQDYYQQLEAEQHESNINDNASLPTEILNEICTEAATLALPAEYINNSAIAIESETFERNYALTHNASTLEITNTQDTDFNKDQVNHITAGAVTVAEVRSTNETEVCDCQAAINTRVESSTNDIFATDIDLTAHIACEPHNIEQESGLAGALAQLRLGEQRTPEQEAYEQLMRRQAWEQGQVDYTGKDSFDNIWKRITQTLENKPTTPSKDGTAAASGSS